MYLKDFEDNANFIFGLNVLDPDFDVFNNPYVLIRGHQMEIRPDDITGFHLTLHELELEPCSMEYVFKVINPMWASFW